MPEATQRKATRIGRGARRSPAGSSLRHVPPPRIQGVHTRLTDAVEQALALPPEVRSSIETDTALFKAAVYAVVRDYFVQGHEDLIRRFVEYLPTPHPQIGFNENPFLWAIYAFRYDNAGLRDYLNLSPFKINNVSWQLLHAFRHRVEPELLMGFLYQTAASTKDKQEKIKKRGTVFYEPWYDNYRVRTESGPPPRLRDQ